MRRGAEPVLVPENDRCDVGLVTPVRGEEVALRGTRASGSDALGVVADAAELAPTVRVDEATLGGCADSDDEVEAADGDAGTARGEDTTLLGVAIGDDERELARELAVGVLGEGAHVPDEKVG